MAHVLLALHVTPKSSRSEIAGWRGGELSVRVTSAPEGGKANAEVCKTIAKALGIPKSSVTVIRGQSSRHKQVRAEGIEAATVVERVGEPEQGLF